MLSDTERNGGGGYGERSHSAVRLDLFKGKTACFKRSYDSIVFLFLVVEPISAVKENTYRKNKHFCGWTMYLSLKYLIELLFTAKIRLLNHST